MVDRRTILKSGFATGAILHLSPALSHAQENPASIRPRVGDLLVKIDDPSLKPLGVDDVRAGSPQIMAWPMDPAEKLVRNGSRLNRIMLLRFDEARLVGETRSRSAAGIVAYTAICTHTGCDVSDWLPDEEMLYCPCHYSKYDPKNGATVADGPAPRPLPALPLKVVDGTLAVAAPFTARVTFEPA